MNRILALSLTFAVVAIVGTARSAEDATGTWKWTATFGDKSIDSTVKLKQEGDKLTGVYVGRNNMETPISEGTVKDNVVSFKVVREFNGNKFESKYSGTLSGDTIKGKSSFQRDGQSQDRDWEAKRQK
jgi:hypothetical protein